MPKETFFNLPSEKKERIKKATYEMFIHNKYEDVHIRDITKKAGISVGSFYQYFHDKDDLYLYYLTKVELKYMNKLKELNESFLIGSTEVPIEDVCTEEEVAFNNTWYSMPTVVMQKFYFGGYSKELHAHVMDEIIEFKKNNRLRESVDIDLIFYIYCTSMFNLHNYFRYKKIESQEKKIAIKEKYFQEMFLNGILKN